MKLIKSKSLMSINSTSGFLLKGIKYNVMLIERYFLRRNMPITLLMNDKLLFTTN